MRIFRLGLASLICFTSLAYSQSYPNRPVTLIVPQAAAGTNDIVARTIAPALSEALKTSVVVENRPGAGGNIGTQSVAKASKDGYTLLLTINSAQAINPALYKNPGFDPINDFVFLSYIGSTPYILVAPPNSQMKLLLLRKNVLESFPMRRLEMGQSIICWVR